MIEKKNKPKSKRSALDAELNLKTALRAQNLRMTQQRRLVLEVLRESREHLDAETIHDQVRQANPRVSLATVYRTLALLKSLGLVDEHRLGEEHGHFEAARETPHYHFTCRRCRKVIEFKAPQIEEVVIPALADQGILVDEAHLTLYGLCPQCRKKSNQGSKYVSIPTKTPQT